MRLYDTDPVNIPPESFVRVPAQALEDFGTELVTAAGLVQDRARQLASLLTGNDLRGVVSHGTVQLATYCRLFRDEKLNPAPRLGVERETGSSLVVDGDGSLGYFAATEATRRVIDKAADAGIAVALTRNHGHFGAAGLYGRMTLGHDLLCFVTSGHQLELQPGQPVSAAAGGSPMCFVTPTGTETPLVLDFGAMHDLYDDETREQITALAPGMVHRAIGMGAVCQSWGGFLAGVPLDPARASRTWPGANQGSMIIVLRIDLFTDPAAFAAEMDAYVRAVHELTPIDPDSSSLLPGGIEAARAEEYGRDGIPVGEDHRGVLGEVAAELGVPTPW